jgi:hypothetical protein
MYGPTALWPFTETPATLAVELRSAVARWLVGEVNRMTSLAVGAASRLQLLPSEKLPETPLLPVQVVFAANACDPASATAADAASDRRCRDMFLMTPPSP